MQLQNLQVIMGSDLFDECKGLEDFLVYIDEFLFNSDTEYGLVYKSTFLNRIREDLDYQDEQEVIMLETLEKVLAPFDSDVMIALQ